MPDPTESTRLINGAQLRVFEWAGEGPTLFFAHATSFHARCWDQVIAALPGRHAIAFDMRGHGASDNPEGPLDWRDWGEDAAELARQLELRGAIAIGHSMGGHSVTIAAALEPERFAALLLVDPVIQQPEDYGLTETLGRETGSRRNEWASPGEMFESYQGRGPFATWDEQVLHDYCDHGLVPAPDGAEGFVLGCPPDVEAALYFAASGTDIYDEVATIEVPVRILRAQEPGPDGGKRFIVSPTAPDLASKFRNAQDVYLPEATHFIPMESPSLVAGHLGELIARL
jgi:pimeloyl-ACP methyl ester carboxylesterase